MSADTKSKNLTFIDFCSGIGGGRLGLELHDFKCLGFSEIDVSAINTYKILHNHQDELDFGDLTKIIPNKLPDVDLIISGFPCQSFSIVGKREGFNNAQKGQIIFYLAKILQIKRPKFFIFENVKGLVNHEKGKTLETILNLLKQCGYNVKFKILNTIDFGLPQSRERVYFVGIRNDLGLEFYFNKPDIVNINLKLESFLSPSKNNLFYEDSQYQTFLKYLNNKYNIGRINLDEILSKNFLVLDTRQSDLRIYENKVPTLRRDRHGIFYVFNKRLHKLSAIESLKLQGFGVIKDLDFKIKDLKNTDILKQSGNAMSVNVISYLAEKIKELAIG